MKTALRAVRIGLGTLALGTGVAAATLPDDPALHKPITLAVKGEALSDVMKLLQDQTGVDLKAQTEVADQKVTIFVDGKPLREVMEGLVTVLKYTWSAQTTNGHGLYEIGESEQARIGRETEWQKMVAKAWDDLDATLKRRAALTVNAAELQAEMERFRAVAENERNKVWGEREKIMRQRDTPVAAAMSGDLAISRLYCHLSTEAMAGLKAGNYVRFDSQSPDAAWKLPADVVEYLAPFVRTEEWVRPELGQKGVKRRTNDSTPTPVWDNYAVMLQASTDPHGVSLGTMVIPRSSAVKEVYRDVQYGNVIASGQLRFPTAVSEPLPEKMQDKALDRQISLTGTEIGEEAQTTAWAWNFQYYVTPSDLLALLHRKLGLQIISDHYTEYLPNDPRSMGAHPIRNALHQIGGPNAHCGWDGNYLYMRRVDIRNADLGEVPNRLLRHWQSVYRTQEYLGLDELAQIGQLSQPQHVILERYARLLGLESIDYLGGWLRTSGPEYVMLYGWLSATQRKEAFAAGTPVALSAEQSHRLEQLMGANSGYLWRRFKASGPTGKIVVGTYDTLWRRLDQPDNPADVELRPMDTPLGSKPVSLTIRKKPGESHYYWFKELSSPWPQHPELLRDVKNEDELLRRLRSNRRMTIANVRLISEDDYEFVLTLADGKTVKGSVSVPLAPVTPAGSVKTGAAAPVVAPVPKEQSQAEGAAILLSKSRGPAARARPQTQPPEQAAAPVLTNIAMAGGVFFDDVAVINNSKPVMSDDFNTGKLTAGWTAPQPRVVVTPVVTNSTNYCLYLNREHGNKTYARHSVQCDDVGALEIKAKVFLPQPAEQWGYSHGKRERTGIGLTTGRDEHRFNISIEISPGELAYHVELGQIKPEIKEPRGRSETYSSRERVITPGKWALLSFKLDPSTGTATVYVDGQPHVSCRYDPSKITTLTELMLATFMGNLEPAVNPRARGLPKESPSRIAKLESTVNAAGEATPSTGTPAGAGQLYFKKLLSRLSAASEDCIRGLGTIQCDYRLMGAYGSEEPPTGKKPPPVKLAVSGKLTIQLPEDRADSEEPPGSFRTFRFEPDAWPMLTDGVGEAEAKELKPFSRPGSKLICSEAEAGSWLVSKDDKTAVRFKMSVGENPLFGEIAPTVCCHYQAPMIMVFRADIRGAISTKGESVSLAGHKCAKHLFELPATGAGAPAGTYTVWLDDATGLPLKEELTGGIERGTTTVTYSDFQPFRKKSFSPAKSEETEPKEDVHCEIEYSPFGTQWFLTKEISVRSSEGEVCKMTFSNWRQVTVPDSAFKLPPGAKVISSEDAPDKGSNSKQ